MTMRAKRLLYLLAIPLTASAVFLQVKYVNADSNTCFAPCVVVFPTTWKRMNCTLITLATRSSRYGEQRKPTWKAGSS